MSHTQDPVIRRASMRRLAGLLAVGSLVLASCADAADDESGSDRTTTTVGSGNTTARPGDRGLEPTVVVDLGSATGSLPAAVPASSVGSRFAAVAGAAVSISPFAECTDLLTHVRSQADGRVGAYGLNGDPWYGFGLDDRMMFEEIALSSEAEGDFDAAPAPAESAGGEPGVDFSTTNVQEAGIDEPDIVKTDGEVVATVIDGSVRLIDVTGDSPVVSSTTWLDSGWDHELLLSGDRLFVLSTDGGYAVAELYRDEDGALPDELYPPIHENAEVTIIRELDISDLTNPQIESTQVIDGRYVTARVVDGVARVVITSRPAELPFVQPGGGRGSEELAAQTNQAVVEASGIDDWLPAVVTVNGQGQVTEERLVDCGQVGRPDEFAGFGLLSVVSIDLGEPLDVTDVVSVLADGDTVYASGEALYVATNAWVDPVVFEDAVNDGDVIDLEEAARQADRTSIHKFDLGAGSTRYVASGVVDGHLLDQFALSEHEGVLRVATTVGETWDESSESFVTTLAEADGELVEQGRVGGLGKGERIYAVRMIEDKGYVVTFRQVDPLYVVDLSDPSNPTVRGELKIPGYSSYLHLVGDDLLLGVGQDADPETGRVEGAQVSLFDVSDPTSPQRIDQLLLGDGNAAAEWDHRAFLWWAPEDLAVLPVDLYDYEFGSGQFNGAIALDLEGRTLTETARLSHGVQEICEYEDWFIDEQGNEVFETIAEPCYHDYSDSIQRSLVIGDDLLTLSAGGVGVHDLTTLADEGYVGF